MFLSKTLVVFPVFWFSIYTHPLISLVHPQNPWRTYFISRLLLTSIDVPTRLATGLGENGLDSADAFGGAGVGAFTVNG